MSERVVAEPFLCPDLLDFASLFTAERRSPEKERTEGEPEAGFPAGSIVLVQGPPGAGKATFALAVARDLIQQLKRVAGEETAKRPLLYLISVENTRDDLSCSARSRDVLPLSPSVYGGTERLFHSPFSSN